ncbi:MAG: hprA [Verrucomicrobiales bacterium]|nr:hprA [Verrucomicrobiales bacterium]
MRIVILDGHTLNPGDLSWEPLHALGDCQIYPRSNPAESLDRSRGAEILLTNKTPVPKELIDSVPDLRYIGVMATGYNIVDVAAARARNVIVTNVPAYGTSAVAQMVFALLLELTQRTGHHSDTVRDGRWSRSPDFCYWDFPLVNLSGKTIGIVGYGRIGQAVAKIADAFGMKVIISRHGTKVHAGVRTVSIDDLFAESDVISLHCPLTADNRGLVNQERLSRMKSTAFLINTSRGPLIDEAALANALNTDQIAGAGLDVLSVEPPPSDNPLLKAPNCIITPHIAWATRESRERLLQIMIENLKAFLAGKPQNVVS